MTDGRIADGGSDFKDRRTGFLVFGILLILFGAFCALMVPFMLFAMAVSAALPQAAASSTSARLVMPSVLFYALLAAWFIWMGIGSMRCRRWARALVLISSWIWLIAGIMGLASMLFLMPDMYDQMARNGQMPRQMVAVMKVFMLGFMTVFYILIPGGLVLFYGSRHAKSTCEQRDPLVRWTDRCPLPVLAASLMCGCGAVCMPLMGFYGWAMPFFGTILSGIAGACVALAGSLLLATVAWGLYRLRVGAWWGAVLLAVAWGASAGLTFSRVGLMAFYEKMDFPAQQLEMMKQFAVPYQRWMVLFCGLWVLIALGYLLYTRRYFKPPAGPGSACPADPA